MILTFHVARLASEQALNQGQVLWVGGDSDVGDIVMFVTL